MKWFVVALSLVCGVAWGQVAPMAQAENAFAVDLYGKLSAQRGNLFFSPYSISTALEMVFVGARGETAAQMGRVLHLGAFASDLPAAVTGEVLFPDAQADGFKFGSANALWGAQGYRFKLDYVAAMKRDFGGDLRAVNFGNPVAAAAEINDWVAEKTAGKIRGLVSPAALSAATRLVLTNAVYFKAGWETPFDLGALDVEKFHVSAGKDVEAHMMHVTTDFTLSAGDGVRVLSVPYRHGDASLVIILPDTADGLEKVEAELTAGKLGAWLAGGQDKRVALTMPRVRDTQAFDLNAVLEAMGVTDAFDPGHSDLTGIADVAGEKLFVSAVLHKANVDIDETGTEAAAATAVIVTMATAMAPRPPVAPVPFVVDHPFIYLIRANQSGEILFMGRVADPAAGGS